MAVQQDRLDTSVTLVAGILGTVWVVIIALFVQGLLGASRQGLESSRSGEASLTSSRRLANEQKASLQVARREGTEAAPWLRLPIDSAMQLVVMGKEPGTPPSLAAPVSTDPDGD
jgi:hypothetical protein